MSAHNPNNSQCDLSMYGPDPGDGSVKCTCDDDPPIEPAVVPLRPDLMNPVINTGEARRRMAQIVGSGQVTSAEPNVITLTGRAASTHAELRAAGHELRAAQDLYRKAEARFKAALDAHMQELA